MWNLELGTTGVQGVERPKRNEKAGKAGAEQRTEESRELSWGQFGKYSSRWQIFIEYLLCAQCFDGGNVGDHESTSNEVQEGFLEEGASPLKPEKQ